VFRISLLCFSFVTIEDLQGLKLFRSNVGGQADPGSSNGIHYLWPGGAPSCLKPSAKSLNRVSTNFPEGSLQAAKKIEPYFFDSLCESGNSKQLVKNLSKYFSKGPPLDFILGNRQKVNTRCIAIFLKDFFFQMLRIALNTK